jgi:hypothetical protein
MGIGLAFVLAAVSIKPSAAEEGSAAKSQEGDARKIWQFESVTATVEAINHDTRVVTLRAGDEVTTVTVDKRVKRLDEINVGDKVKTEYYVSLASEIREPTAEEKEMPVTVLDTAARAPFSMPPGATAMRQIKAVMTVEEIDRAEEQVTLRLPSGESVTVHPLDPSRLDKVSVGDTVVVTHTEALAIYLEEIE